MKKIILNLLFIYFSLAIHLSFAQTPNILNGPEYKYGPEGSHVAQMIGSDDKGFFIMRRTGNPSKAWLEKYKMDLSVEFTSFIKLPVIDRKSLNVENLLYVKNTFILFTSFYDKEKDNNSIYANLLDPLSGKLTATKEIGVIPATSARKKGSFSINFSTDSTKLLVTQESALNNENSTKIGFTVFDLQLKILWNKDFTLPFKDKNHYIGTTLLDKDGNLHILTQIFLEKEERGKDTPSYYYQVLSYFHSGDDLKNMT